MVAIDSNLFVMVLVAIIIVLIIRVGYFLYQCSHCVDQFIELVKNESSLSEGLAEWNDIIDWEVQ